MTSKQKIDITNYTSEQIDDILFNCSIRQMLTNYKLTSDFCIRYILTTDEYASGVEDSYYDVDDVLLFQTHLTMDDLEEACKKINAEKNK